MKPARTATGILFGLISLLPAAQISWQASEDMYQGTTSEGFVSTLGTSILAVNPSESDNGTITLNGVDFLRASLTDLHSGISANGVTLTMTSGIGNLAGPGTFGDGDFNGNTGIYNVIAGAAYGHGSITFSGLTAGKSYAIQVMTNDARNGRSNLFKLNLSDGITNVTASMASGTAGQADLDNRDSVTGEGVASGDAILGTFVADSSSQTFEIAGENNGNPDAGRSQVNAIQIREIPAIYEAENFTAMSGIVIENKGATSDSIGYIENGDWADYLINVPAPGTYRFSFSAASNSNGGDIEIVSNGSTIGTATIPKTNGWDNWQPFTTNATFTSSGSQTIRLNFVSDTNTSALYNLDSFSFEVIQPITIVVGNTPKQTMRYGMDYERLWYWTGGLNASERDTVARWSVVDNDIDFIRVAINSAYELTEGTYDLTAYTDKIIPLMQEMQEANPDIKFFASPRPLNEAVSGVAWQPYPQWITGSTGTNSNFSFDWEKCAQYLVRYIQLMKSYGFKISYMDLTNEWNYVTATHFRDIKAHFVANLPAEDIPLLVGPSAWSYAQGASWFNGATNTLRRNAIDVAAAHNTDKTGTAQDFADKINTVYPGENKEIWNTEVHGWKSTSGENEVLSFSFMLEAINAGFSGLSGWLAIGTTNQGHSYILNPSGTPSRNVKYFIFNKLTNTSHRGQALDIETPAELSHTTALLKGNLLTVWAINPNTASVNLALDLNGRTSTNQSIIRTRWHTSLAVEGESTTLTSIDPAIIPATVPGESLCCFEILLDPPTGPVTRFEAESHDAQSGTRLENTSNDDGNQNVAYISNNDWVRYDNVTLAENAFARFRIARPAGLPDSQIEVRLGSPTGTLIGSASVPETGGWQSWQTIETQLTNPAGTYDLYLVFIEEGVVSNVSLLNLNWFALTLGVTPITAENLIVESASLNAGFFTFTAPHSGSGLLYQVQVSNDLTPDNWTDTGATVTGTGGPLDFQVAVTPAQTERFFRLKITSP